MIRVAVIDNDPMVGAGLRALLAGAEDIEVAVVSRTLAEHLSSGVGVDVVLMDLQLDDGTQPPTRVAALRVTGARVLMISVHGDRRQVRATLHAGASGYLLKDDDPARLAGAVREVHAGDRWVLSTELMSLVHADPPELSDRQREVLQLYGTGSTLAAVAHRLGVSIATVRSHLERIADKWAAVGEPVEDFGELAEFYRWNRPAPPS
jgi:DNA-binding NarL/FixJ family response regulator